MKRKGSDSLIAEKKNQIVELPITEFVGINFITAMVPFYICLVIFLGALYLFVEFLSLSLVYLSFIFPVLVFILYHLYILLMIEVCALWVRIWNKKSPPRQGAFRRVLDDVKSAEGKMLKYYHRRGFIIKFPVWLSSKCPFPWMLNRALRRIGHNTIDKNVIYCDGFPGLELTTLKKNSFIYPSSAISSHSVQSIFGKITIKEVVIGKNAVLYPGCIAGPGAQMEDNFILHPNSGLPKDWRGNKESTHYIGMPGRPIEEKEIYKDFTKNTKDFTREK